MQKRSGGVRFVAASLVAGAALAQWGTPRGASAECVRQCPPGTPRDAEGCCQGGARVPGPGPTQKPPPPPPTTQPPPQGCPPGQEKNIDTAGHCCYPGQAWNGSSCIGLPTRCPPGYSPDRQRQTCEVGGCGPGQQRTTDGVHCCWPAQVWAQGQQRCVGLPQCPAGMTATDAGCVQSDPVVRLGGGQIKLSRGDFVTVNAFAIDQTEVTVAAYGICVSQGRCTPPEPGDHCNWGRSDRQNNPINCVDWNQATQYCAGQGKRLPTEEEWEWAATGAGRGYKYPWGNDEPTAQLCWRRWDSRAGTCTVGSFPRGDTPQGVKDLSGNVWEWTASTYPGTTDRVFRGGSWPRVDAAEFIAGSRGWRPANYKLFDVGFRCAR